MYKLKQEIILNKNMKVFTSIVLIFIYTFGIACTIVHADEHTKIVHIVLVWLKEPDNQVQINNVINATIDLSDIPGIQEIRVGKSVESEREIVDDSFDVALYMIFNTREDLQRYLVHSKHVETVKTILQPLARKILVYDFEDISGLE